MDLTTLRSAAQKHVQQIVKHETTPPCLRNLTTSNSLDCDIVAKIIHPSENKSAIQLHEDVIILEACLRPHNLKYPITTLQHVQEWVANAILPGETSAGKALYSTEGRLGSSPAEYRRLQAMYRAGLQLLSHLPDFAALREKEITIECLLCLASFTDEQDPWTGEEVFLEAAHLLGRYLGAIKPTPKKLDALLARLLQEEIKPRFAASKSKEITAEGRKAISQSSQPFLPTDQEASNKPWKFRDIYIVTVFKWVLTQLDASQIEANWPLIIPPLLALIDDSSTTYKVKGCELLTKFLTSSPSHILESRGLGEVFQNALTPYLLYLPTLTPEEESLQLLNAVYPTLIILVNARYSREQDRVPRMKAFDQLLRYGVFKGYAHAGECARIAEILVQRIADLVNEMGIASVKHLKHILPLLSEILTAPFALAYPPLLQAAVQATNAVVFNDWPRVAHHRGDVLEGLITCWCRIQEEGSLSPELIALNESCERTVRKLTAVLKEVVDVEGEFKVLVDNDSGLRGILAPKTDERESSDGRWLAI